MCTQIQQLRDEIWLKSIRYRFDPHWGKLYEDTLQLANDLVKLERDMFECLKSEEKNVG